MMVVAEALRFDDMGEHGGTVGWPLAQPHKVDPKNCCGRSSCARSASLLERRSAAARASLRLRSWYSTTVENSHLIF
jgi:hypothetical protein